ncbi:hypothetical protein AB0442_03265 [Kitasatospora sp. NPDC085895]|uniref:hypothetical protein n=1 Tax=Kitasatospora sp. NPDC085895 TaxID=3155057 RepID=UPI00344D7222
MTASTSPPARASRIPASTASAAHRAGASAFATAKTRFSPSTQAGRRRPASAPPCSTNTV